MLLLMSIISIGIGFSRSFDGIAGEEKSKDGLERMNLFSVVRQNRMRNKYALRL